MTDGGPSRRRPWRGRLGPPLGKLAVGAGAPCLGRRHPVPLGRRRAAVGRGPSRFAPPACTPVLAQGGRRGARELEGERGEEAGQSRHLGRETKSRWKRPRWGRQKKKRGQPPIVGRGKAPAQLAARHKKERGAGARKIRGRSSVVGQGEELAQQARAMKRKRESGGPFFFQREMNRAAQEKIKERKEWAGTWLKRRGLS
uniref:Uncharacterized protein n=1 Tax=Setaria viridis TaxID=4556 RepID=A0A4U6W4B8_SETVI|nr:hypothetical protein SEVIR_2G161500v2 [Setaria viridis]